METVFMLITYQDGYIEYNGYMENALRKKKGLIKELVT